MYSSSELTQVGLVTAVMFAFILAIFFYHSFATAVDPVDPYDLSFLRKGAAIGDSYVSLIMKSEKMTS